MSHSATFEVGDGGLVLSNAILLYRPASRSALDAHDERAFASYHAVEHAVGGTPVIAAGAALTRAHLRQWTEALGRNAGPEILPPGVLVAHADMIAWWTPAQVRPAYFALTHPPKGLKAIAGRTVVALPHPAHLFIATRHALGVFALAESARPDAATVVLHSPVLNVFLDGRLCWGDIARPKTLSVAAIPEFERAVFDSWSTHPNPGQELTISGKGGLVRLWDDLAARKARRFPVRRLKPFNPAVRGRAKAAPITLGELVGRFGGREGR